MVRDPWDFDESAEQADQDVFTRLAAEWQDVYEPKASEMLGRSNEN